MKINSLQRVILCLSLLLLPVLAGEGLYYFRKGFSPRRLQPLGIQTKESAISPEIQCILAQPFYFLGRGRQCFAFESQDGKYVLKVPRTDIYRIPLWTRILTPRKYQEVIKAEKERRRTFVFKSFRIAMDELREETGTIAIHLSQTPVQGSSLHLVDSLGISHRFSPNSTLFILQHKKKLWTTQFLKAKDIEEKTKLIHALLDVMTLRGRKQVFNRDRSFLRNYGFDEEKAFQIDIGDFYHIDSLDPAFALQKSVRDSMEPVQEWLAKTDPSMLSVIQERLDALRD